jgi:hypothetical protein
MASSMIRMVLKIIENEYNVKLEETHYLTFFYLLLI